MTLRKGKNRHNFIQPAPFFRRPEQADGYRISGLTV